MLECPQSSDLSTSTFTGADLLRGIPAGREPRGAPGLLRVEVDGARRRGRCAALVVAVMLATPCPAAPVGDPPLPPERPADLAVSGPAVPLPPTRPPDVAAPSPAAPPPPPPVATAEALQTCADLLASGRVAARTLPAVAGPGGCGMAAPVEVSAVVLASGTAVALRPPVQVACPLAGAMADWVRDDLAPAFAAAGRRLEALSGTSGYACRPRDGVAGAKLSEHALGDAVDVGGFVAEGGPTVAVTDAGPASILLAEVQRTACARFTTVLGPGSDAFHATHMHVDLRARHGGTCICEWTLP